MGRQRGGRQLFKVSNRPCSGMRNSTICETTAFCPFPTEKPLAVLHIHLPILYSVFMRTGNITKISLLEPVRYPLNPNMVCLILETLLILLADLFACRHCCRPQQGRRQSKSASHPRINDHLVLQPNDHSRQPDNDRSGQPTS